MFRVRKTASGFTAETVFVHDADEWNSEVHTPIVFEKHLFAVGKKKRGLFTCLDLDGKQVWTSEGKASFELGSFILADGMFLILEGKTGMLRLLEASTRAVQGAGERPGPERPRRLGPLALVRREARPAGPRPHGLPRREGAVSRWRARAARNTG